MSTATASRPKPKEYVKPRYRTIINADGEAIIVPDYEDRDTQARESEARSEKERDEARERVRALRGNARPRPRPYDFGRDDYRFGSETRRFDSEFRQRYAGGMSGPEASGCTCEDCKRARGESQQPEPCNECARLNEKVRLQDATLVEQVEANVKLNAEADALAAEFERVVEQNAELRESIEWYSSEIMQAWEKIEEFNAVAA